LPLGIAAVLPGEERDDKQRAQHHCQKGGTCVFEF
jgi:general stress protein YciG